MDSSTVIFIALNIGSYLLHMFHLKSKSTCNKPGSCFYCSTDIEEKDEEKSQPTTNTTTIIIPTAATSDKLTSSHHSRKQPKLELIEDISPPSSLSSEDHPRHHHHSPHRQKTNSHHQIYNYNQQSQHNSPDRSPQRHHSSNRNSPHHHDQTLTNICNTPNLSSFNKNTPPSILRLADSPKLNTFIRKIKNNNKHDRLSPHTAHDNIGNRSPKSHRRCKSEMNTPESRFKSHAVIDASHDFSNSDMYVDHILKDNYKSRPVSSSSDLLNTFINMVNDSKVNVQMSTIDSNSNSNSNNSNSNSENKEFEYPSSEDSN